MEWYNEVLQQEFSPEAGICRISGYDLYDQKNPQKVIYSLSCSIQFYLHSRYMHVNNCHALLEFLEDLQLINL